MDKTSDECESLTRAFSGLGGLGVDEKSLISALGKWRDHDNLNQFRRSSTKFFKAGGNGRDYKFELWEKELAKQLKYEFARFKKLMVLWAMHPWERDARWSHHVLHKSRPFAILVEISCTRSSEELLGARRAYQSLYHQSLEEGVADHVKEYSALLIGLVSSYRYEGPCVNEQTAKSEAKIIANEIKKGGAKRAAENENVIRILTTRSKNQLRLTFKFYKEMTGKSLVEDLEEGSCLRETVLCLDSPPSYFSKVIHDSLKDGATSTNKDALSRVVVTRAGVDMKKIKEEYQKKYGAKLDEDIQKYTYGNYKDALLSLINRQD